MRVNEQRAQGERAARTASRRGCLGLMLGAVVFIVVVYGIIITYMNMTRTPENQASERNAVVQCRQRIESAEPGEISEHFRNACEEMAEQYQDKYGRDAMASPADE